jgi:ATP-dependent DNA helicase PIF1
MIDLNDQFTKAIEAIQAHKNLFITGKAGTGKSTLLQYYRDHYGMGTVFLAPTGVAALNIKGQTIHSFFGFRPDITIEKIAAGEGSKRGNIFRALKTIVIDEASMVRADLLDCVDAFLRRARGNYAHPFGGVQMIFVGDLYQLPPVLTWQESKAFHTIYKSPYFFSSKSFQDFKFEIIELDHIYRQTDFDFIKVLNNIREGEFDADSFKLLNSRVFPLHSNGTGAITLTSTKALSEAVNNSHLEALPGSPLSYKGEIFGSFDRSYMPVAENLSLKPGCQVMLLNNEANGRWVNGSLAVVDSVHEKYIKVKLPTEDDPIRIDPVRWEIFRTYIEDDQLQTSSIGSYSQIPAMLAWSCTIHKVQGQTFEKIIIDTGRGAFAHGQIYVALSRCRTLEGIVLRQAIKAEHIHVDPEIKSFLRRVK